MCYNENVRKINIDWGNKRYGRSKKNNNARFKR